MAVKPKIKKTLSSASHSRYWLDKNLFDQDATEKESGADLERIMRLATARRAVSNFVNILTGRNDIPVKYSSGQSSYTDGKEIVIAADDNPENFDSMVGLALHEGSHCLLTNFDFLRGIGGYREALRERTSPPTYWHCENRKGPEEYEPHVFHALLHPSLAKLVPEFPAALLHQYKVNKWQTIGSEEWRGLPFWSVLERMLSDIHQLMNILEDRRIDKYVYQNASGYRPYYTALYNRYFFTEESGKNLKYNPEWRELTVENYLSRLLYAFHPDSDLDAMPGLRELVAKMELDTIERIAPEHDKKVTINDKVVEAWRDSAAYDDAPNIWRLANELYAMILKYVSAGELTKDRSEDGEGEGEVFVGVSAGDIEDALGNEFDLPNLDGGVMAPAPVETRNGKPGKYNEEKGKRDLQKALDALNGNVKKKKATKYEQEAVSAMDAANAKLEDVTGDGVPFGKCIVTRKMNDALFQQDWFIFKHWAWQTNEAPLYITDAIAAGKRMGQILAHRLQVRNDPLLTKQTRLPNGGLDRRLLAQLGIENTNVFQKSRVDQYRPVMLHLTLDASGSMHGEKWAKALTVATAVAFLSSKVRNVDAVITIRGGYNLPIVSVVYDSRKDTFQKFAKYARRLEPSGGTPEGLCYAATMDMILESASTHDVYFINFSDGEPSFSLNRKSVGLKQQGSRWESGNHCEYHGELAAKHTRAQIQKMRERGVKVLSYFISHSRQYAGSSLYFKKMYGDDAVFVNVTNATEVLRTLNKLLLKRGS